MSCHPGTGREVTTVLCDAGTRTLDALLRLSRWLLGLSPGLVSSAQIWAAEPHCTLPIVGPPKSLATSQTWNLKL